MPKHFFKIVVFDGFIRKFETGRFFLETVYSVSI